MHHISDGKFRFREEFIQYMNDRKAFPSKREMRSERTSKGFVRDDTYLLARKGAQFEITDLAEIVRALLEHPASRSVMLEYLKWIQYPIRDETNDKDLFNITVRLTTDGEPIEQHEDKFQLGIEYLTSIFVRIKPEDVCQLAKPEQMPDTIRWCYVTSGRDIRNDPRLVAEDAIAACEEVIGLSIADYAAIVAQWMTKSPWIALHSWQTLPLTNNQAQSGVATGMSVILPVKDEVYEDVRAGKRQNYECTADDIEVPSRSLLIQMVAERPISSELPGSINRTTSLRHSSLIQACVLAHREKRHKSQPVRFLVNAGTDTNRERIVKSGFKRVEGLTGLAAKVGVYEQVIHSGWKQSHPAEAAFLMFLAYYGHSVKDAPPDHFTW